MLNAHVLISGRVNFITASVKFVQYDIPPVRTRILIGKKKFFFFNTPDGTQRRDFIVPRERWIYYVCGEGVYRAVHVFAIDNDVNLYR